MIRVARQELPKPDRAVAAGPIGYLKRRDFSSDTPQTAKTPRLKNPVIHWGKLVLSPGLKTS